MLISGGRDVDGGCSTGFLSAAARLVQPVCHKRAAISTLAIYIPASGLIHYNRLARDRATTRGAPARNAESFCTVHFGTTIHTTSETFPYFRPILFPKRTREKWRFIAAMKHTHEGRSAVRVGTEFSTVHDDPRGPSFAVAIVACFQSSFACWLTNFWLGGAPEIGRLLLRDTRWLSSKKKFFKFVVDFITKCWRVRKRLKIFIDLLWIR